MVYKIGDSLVSTENVKTKDLLEFIDVHAKRPILDNQYGMKAPHLFWTWYIFKTLQPKFIIESGIYKGLGTWIMRQACPEAKMFCIDIDLSHREYIDENAVYFDTDFNNIFWGGVCLILQKP